MPPATQFLLDPSQRARHAFRDRLAPELETASSVLRAVVREAQEVERLRLALPPHSTVRVGEPPELDEPGLVGVNAQVEAPKALFQVVHESLRIAPVLEAHHEVVGISDDNRLAFDRAGAPPPLKPQIQDVVQVNVGQDRIWEPYGYGNLSPCER